MPQLLSKFGDEDDALRRTQQTTVRLASLEDRKLALHQTPPPRHPDPIVLLQGF